MIETVAYCRMVFVELPQPEIVASPVGELETSGRDIGCIDCEKSSGSESCNRAMSYGEIPLK